MRTLGVLSPRGGATYARNCHVIVRTNRGMEAGEVLCEATDRAVAQAKSASHGQILRPMSEADQKELGHLRANESEALATCKKHVKQLGLDMQLVDIEHLFGGERVVIFYLAEERVDFRELVKQLAAEFQTRIEMRQIRVRDEAKLLAD